MFIQTEQTPNPKTLKFLPGETVLENGTAFFETKRAAEDASPLAAALFQIKDVSGVFFGFDFITITSEDGDWDEIKPMALGVIMEHYMGGISVMFENRAASESSEGRTDRTEEEEDIILQIKDLLDERVRPAVARDGGDITFYDYQDGVVFLQMKGACSGCPSSTATLQHGVQNLLKHYIPEIQSVEAVA